MNNLRKSISCDTLYIYCSPITKLSVSLHYAYWQSYFMINILISTFLHVLYRTAGLIDTQKEIARSYEILRLQSSSPAVYRQRFTTVLYRNVHFLSSIYTPCFSFKRILLRLNCTRQYQQQQHAALKDDQSPSIQSMEILTAYRGEIVQILRGRCDRISNMNRMFTDLGYRIPGGHQLKRQDHEVFSFGIYS